jgi:alkanesulfonate monooxygenase SsuD/methylene tetrahydromethanopterin reductase-like flavin-dependent oxidoreductase (luciferase family)
MYFDMGLFTGQVPPGSDQTPSERYRDLLALAPLLESAGFDKAWVSEHHFVDDGYLPSVLPFCAALGARTETLRVGTGVALAPFYDPIRFAEDAATVDLVTGGRFEAGLAIGWTDEEFEVFDVPKRRRVAYLRELIAILRAAGDDDPLVHDGDVHRYDGVDVRPKPVQDELPVWIGGTVDAAVERAGRIADGYFATPTPLDELARRRDLAVEAADDERFPIAEWRYTHVSEDGDAWDRMKQHAWHIKRQYVEWATGEPQPRTLPAEMEDDLRAECLVGTPAEVREAVERRRDRMGDDYRLCTRMTLPGLPIEDVRESVRLFGSEVVDELA